MNTVTINIPAKEIPQLLKAARELEIDMITDKGEGEVVPCHFIIYDYYQLILLGIIMGMNLAYQSMSEPIKEVIERIETAQKSFKEKNNDKS